MKSFFAIFTSGLLFFGIVLAGCMSLSMPVQAPISPGALAVPSPVLTAVPTVVPYPNARELDEYTCFGGDEMGQAAATVYRYEIRPYYNWTSSSWNSPREQASASQPFELQNGYTMEKPGKGNIFLFIFIRVENDGARIAYAPSAKQFVVYNDGKMYNYSPVHSPDVIIDKVSGKQYGYQTGEQEGSVMYIQPGESNRADGYLIYEIPAPFSPGTTYVVSNLGSQDRAEWMLD
jgi:hypothetical protein